MNLINDGFFNNISREIAENTKLKDTDIYINNNILIDEFIKFYNKERKDFQEKKLSINNNLSDFFIDSSNYFGKSYKTIYKNFINLQNKNIERLLEDKIDKGIFDINCKNKINIQQIN